MKKLAIFMMVVMTLLFTSCGTRSSKSVDETSAPVETVTDTVDTTETAVEVADTTEVVDTAE